MSKFIELTDDEIKRYFNIDNICCFFWSEETDETKIFMTDNDEKPFCVSETPAEIMAKIREVQNG